MKNYIQSGDSLTLPAAPATVVSGQGVLIGSIFGVAAESAATGAEFTLVTKGVFSLPKASTDVIAIGTRVYWDHTAQDITVTATNNTLVGVALSAAANPSASVNVRLNGSF